MLAPLPVTVLPRLSRHRARLALFGLACFAAGGLTVTLAAPRAAEAQSYSSSIQVPRGGLAFRSADGHVIARLSYDSHGGTFEVLDEHGAPTAAMGPQPHPIAAPVVGPNTVWSLDDTPDPWLREGAPATTARPPSGL